MRSGIVLGNPEPDGQTPVGGGAVSSEPEQPPDVSEIEFDTIFGWWVSDGRRRDHLHLRNR